MRGATEETNNLANGNRDAERASEEKTVEEDGAYSLLFCITPRRAQREHLQTRI